MTAENAQKCYDGAKTMTRRIMKPQPADNPFRIAGEKWGHLDGGFYFCGIKCPYGYVGDRLWVRETWAMRSDVEPDTSKAKRYLRFKGQSADLDMEWHHYEKWRPSIHMPRWSCRTVLEVVSLRVERLQDCSRGDAMAEGCPFPNMTHGHDPRQWYADLWESINGKGSWSENPWVWVIGFKKVNNA